MAKHLDRTGLRGKKGGLRFSKGGDGRADRLEGPKSRALNIRVEGAQRGEDGVGEGQHIVTGDAIKPRGGMFVQTAKVGPETSRSDGSKGLRRRRREVREALKEHIPPGFIELGCSTPIRSPESGKPINGSVSV